MKKQFLNKVKLREKKSFLAQTYGKYQDNCEWSKREKILKGLRLETS